MYDSNLMGMKLDNPVVAAPGPWTRGIENLKKILEAEPGALITESIVSESYPDTRPRYHYDRKTRGLENIRIYSGQELEEWICDLEEVEKNDRYGSKTKLIASVMGTTASEVAYISKKIEKTGIDGIELGLACPMGEGRRTAASDPGLVYEFTGRVVDAVDVPVSVKLGADFGSLEAAVKAAEKGGASGISAIDALRCIISIDTETMKPVLPTYGGYSGAPIRPVGLAVVAEIAQSSELPVMGAGGITCLNDLLEYIMAGASCCGIGTALLMQGCGIIGKMKKALAAWMKEKNISSLDDIRGKVLSELRSFEEIEQNEKTAEIMGGCTGCSGNPGEKGMFPCVSSCLEEAVKTKGGEIVIERSKCDGCGLCVSVCPESRIGLSW